MTTTQEPARQHLEVRVIINVPDGLSRADVITTPDARWTRADALAEELRMAVDAVLERYDGETTERLRLCHLT